MELFNLSKGLLSEGMSMSQTAEIKIIVDPSLLDHFDKGLQQLHSNRPAEHEITRLLALILDSSEYPVRAKRTGEKEIRISYHLRSFSEPIF